MFTFQQILLGWLNEGWEDMVNAYGILIGKPEGKRSFGGPGLWFEDNIKIPIWEIDFGMWITLTWIGTTGGFCEHGNETSGFIKYG